MKKTAATLILFFTYGPSAQAFDWDALWQRADQRGLHYLRDNQAEKAANTFKDPNWQATARYRQGQYQQAAELLATQHSAMAHYNRGNALAQAGQLDAALNAYQQALANNPKHADALFNHDTLKNWRDQQQKQPPPEPPPQDASGEDETSAENAQSQPGNSPQEQSQAGDSASEQTPQADQAKAQPQHKPSPAEQADPNPQAQPAPQQHHTADNSAKDTPNDDSLAKKPPPAPVEPSSLPQEQTPLADESPDELPNSDESTESREQRQAAEHWLRKIPDDPGGLFREKLRREYLRGNRHQNEQKIW